MLERYLEDLENRLDLTAEEELYAEWHRFLEQKWPEPIFRPKRKNAAPPTLEWPKILINDAVKDPEKMLIRELAAASNILKDGSGNILNIRCNYGTGILPSLFEGVELFYLDDQHDTLPTTRPLTDGADGVRRLLDTGIPNLNRGWGAQVFETAAYYREKLAHYPKLKSAIQIYHPDLQGPADLAEMIWGSDIFMAFYDTPELLNSFLELLTETYTRFIDRWEHEFPSALHGFHAHWGWGHRGAIVLRDDSAMNLSPELYREFAYPFDAKLLKRYGGVVHFCGRGDHYIDILCEAPGLNGIQLSQPEHNDMEIIFRHTIDRGIPLFGLHRKTAEQLSQPGRDLTGLVHCG